MENNKEYNPDVLNCIANLSNDEVFTPPQLVNEMLDLLPQELFSNPQARFLDPFTKSGVFLREIVKRLDVGLASIIPDRQERILHIMHNQIFGIALTELTSLLARRTVYCSKYANSEHSIGRFKTKEGDILYTPMQHSWQNGRCQYCGASKEVFDRGDAAETYAYNFIHTNNPEKFFPNMTFDVIIGNPPYQLNVGVEKENYAIAIYHKFVQQAKKLNPHYLCMIIPARWYAGGRGLDEFRDEMLHDNRICVIHDYPDASDVFPGVQIKAGVCYFLWNKKAQGKCSITTHMNGELYGPIMRPLLEKNTDIFIRYNQSISIYNKVLRDLQVSFSSLVSTQTPFGIITSEKGTKERKHIDDIPMYISGNEKENKGMVTYIEKKKVTRGEKLIDCHKVYIGKAGSGSDSFPHSILSTPFYGKPHTVCNQTYLVIGPFPNEQICNNVISYIKTRFFRFLVLLHKNSQDAMRGVYQFVPLQDFSEPWTDEKLYKKYNLSEEEIAFIESMIRPME